MRRDAGRQRFCLREVLWGLIGYNEVFHESTDI